MAFWAASLLFRERREALVPLTRGPSGTSVDDVYFEIISSPSQTSRELNSRILAEDIQFLRRQKAIEDAARRRRELRRKLEAAGIYPQKHCCF